MSIDTQTSDLLTTLERAIASVRERLGSAEERIDDEVAERLERSQGALAATLDDIVPIIPMSQVYAEEGGRPATAEEFAALAEQAQPPDGEG